jgi:HEPN domain-containing protein
MDYEEVVQYWLTAADDDLKAAEHLYQARDYTHALFIAHMYLEKTLKALVVRRTGHQAPASHNLRYLAEVSGIGLNLEREGFLVRVTEYSTRTRYPDMGFQFKRQCTRELCQEELTNIEAFGRWIRAILSS